MAPTHKVCLVAWRFLLLGLVELLVLGAAVASKVTLEDNSYNNLVVALDPNASPPSPSDQEKILQDIRTLFTETSAAVFVATEQRAYFGNITIVVPHSWQESVADGDASGGESWRKAHVRVVEGDGPTQGPHTVEGGGCGVGGARVELPRAYLTQPAIQEMYGAPGKVMAQEWFKYRYGVYEEHGYPGDEVYPHVYLDVLTNETRPTGCTNHQALQGSWVNRGGGDCDPLATGGTTGDAECRFRIDGTTSDYSMMFITHVEQVSRVCSAETHDKLAPTRHNRLCGGASVWQVMSRHPDFSDDNNNPPAGAGVSTIPSFSVVRTVTPALFVLVDDNCGNNDSVCEGLTVYNDLQGTLREVLLQGDILMAGIARYRLFRETNVVALFQKTVLLPLTDIDIDEFVNFLPLNENKDSATNPEYALVNILQKLAESAYSGEVSMLLVQMVNTGEDGSTYPTHLLERVRITGVLYGSETFNPWMQDVTETTGGDLYFSRTYSPHVAQQALLSLLPENTQVTVTQQEVSLEVEAEVEVYIDGTVGIATNFMVKFSKDGGSFKIISPDGNETPVNSDPFTYVVPDAQEGLWRMLVSNKDGKGTAEVLVTTSGRPGVEQVEVTTWTSTPSQGDLDLQTSNLAFYVSVTQGRNAVKDLAVTVTFYSGSSSSSRVEVTLWDDGYGDPDVQLEDGIYSGYVTDFGNQASASQTRLYADVTITPAAPTTHVRAVATHARNTRVLPQDPFVEEPCCGSVSGSGAVKLPVARYVASATTLTTHNGPGLQPYDPPPSQISNVVATSVDQDGPLVDAGTVLVELKWNAPGKDLTSGTVTRYEVWYSHSLDEIMTNFESCKLVEDDQYLDGPPTPLPYGELQQATVILPKIVNDVTQYFLVVLGVDSDQKGTPSPPMSVIVTAGVDFTTAATTTTTTAPTTATSTATTTTTATPTATTTTTATPTATTTTATSISTTTAPTTTSPTTATSTEPTTTVPTTATPTAPTTTATSTPTTTVPTTATSTATTTVGETMTATDDSSPSSSTDEPTEQPPDPDFVGSVAFWTIIGVGSGSVAVVAGAIMLRSYFRSKGAPRLTPSNTGPITQDASLEETVAVFKAEEGKSSVNSADGATAGPGDSTGGTTEPVEPVKSSAEPMEVINEGFEEDEENKGDVLTDL